MKSCYKVGVNEVLEEVDQGRTPSTGFKKDYFRLGRSIACNWFINSCG